MRFIDSSARMSQAVVANGFVYLAGQVAPGPDVASQTAAILERIDLLLRQAGSERRLLVSANVWLTDIATFAEMNGVWDQWVADITPPARACVEARLADPQFSVEIAAVALAGPQYVGVT